MSNELLLRAWVAVQAARVTTAHRLASDERGEGVISAAMAAHRLQWHTWMLPSTAGSAATAKALV